MSAAHTTGVSDHANLPLPHSHAGAGARVTRLDRWLAAQVQRRIADGPVRLELWDETAGGAWAGAGFRSVTGTPTMWCAGIQSPGADRQASCFAGRKTPLRRATATSSSKTR